jgi:zinc protease
LSTEWLDIRVRHAAIALVAAATLVSCAAPASAPQTAQGERLPTDPVLVTGTLDNGLAYVVRPHTNPPGRVAVWLHVGSGSLNETDSTRGLAHFLEHMAFNGSTNFPTGSVIPFFQSLGMAFGRDQNAFTGLDQTVYTLALPDTKPETLDRGLLFLSDVASRLALRASEIDPERQIVLEEKRFRAGASERVGDEVLKRLAPESTLARRLPIGTEETIRAIGPADFRDYYRRWYVASNMTVIVVGDLAAPDAVAAIAKNFGAMPRHPRPDPRPVGVKATAGTRGIVVTDPELTQAEVSLTRVTPPRPPVATAEAYRERLVDDLAFWMFRRRLAALLDSGKAAFSQGTASAADWGGALRMATAQATTTPERWRAALSDLGAEIQRVRQHGFTAPELDDARAASLAAAEQAAEQEATLPARNLLRQISQAVTRREPKLSAAQVLELSRRLLPGISATETTSAFSTALDPSGLVFTLTLPASAPPPSEDEMAGLGRTALDVRTDAPTARARPDKLLPATPAGAAVVDGAAHAATLVWSGWLDNGVRVHHRQVEQPKGRATITITLAGGEIEEGVTNRGVTEAAASAWDRPATSKLSSTEVRTIMTGRKVTVQTDMGPDTVALSVAGDPAALERGLELAFLLLTDPLVESAGFEQWRQNKLAEVAERALTPRGVFAEALAAAFFPADDARLHPVSTAQVTALSRDAVQAWLTRLIARAPIEVAVVGDIPRERSLELISRYLGSLPARARISDKTLHDLRAVRRPPGPIAVSRSVPTRTDQAQVIDGFFGADVQEVRQSRLLGLAARVLSTRMNKVIREERQLVYSIGARSRPGDAYPGFGSFTAQAPTEPAKAEKLAGAIQEMYAAFAATGPTAEELTVAKRQVANQLDEAMRTPAFWTDRLSTLDYRGLSLDDLARIRADYETFTADEVRETFARHFRPEARFRVVIVPAQAR